MKRRSRVSMVQSWVVLLAVGLSLVCASSIGSSSLEATPAPVAANLKAHSSNNSVTVRGLHEGTIARVYDANGLFLGMATYRKKGDITDSSSRVVIEIGLTTGKAVYVTIQDVGKAESEKTAVIPEPTKMTEIFAIARWEGSELKIEVHYDALIPTHLADVDASQFKMTQSTTGLSFQAFSVAGSQRISGTAIASTMIEVTFKDIKELGTQGLQLHYEEQKTRILKDHRGNSVKSPDSTLVSLLVPGTVPSVPFKVSFEGVRPTRHTTHLSTNTEMVTVPLGTNINALKPIIQIPLGARVSPASGVVQDFTRPVIYTVTAEDQSTRQHTVVVSYAGTPFPVIDSFSIDLPPSLPAQICTVTRIISLKVPYGTDVTRLTPIIKHTGDNISPASQVAQDFTNPVIYDVTSTDGRIQDYVVVVTVADNPVKSIDSFTLRNGSQDILGIIDEATKTVNVTLPAGISPMGLIPVIEYTGARLSPPSQIAQDFSKPVVYTVIAQDGSSQEYVVYVTAPTSQSRVLQARVGVAGYTVDGVSIPMAACYYSGNDTFMPVRMLEEFYVRFEWNEEKQTVNMWYDDNTVILTIGSTHALVNGVSTPIRGSSGVLLAPELRQGRTMIPLRFVSESLGFTVEWTPDNVITISLL